MTGERLPGALKELGAPSNGRRNCKAAARAKSQAPYECLRMNFTPQYDTLESKNPVFGVEAEVG
jgi:hypothetical protein